MKKNLIILSLSLLLLSCNSKDEKNVIIEKPDVTVENGKLTPELLWAFGRIGEFAVSPDGSTIAYTVTYYDINQNKGNAEIYLMNADGTNVRQLTRTPKSEYNLVWLDDSNLAFLYEGEMYKQLKDNTVAQKIEGESSIEGFSVSPDMRHVLLVKNILVNKPEQELFKGLDKTSGRLIENLNYRHWDSWVDEIPHLFLADFDGKTVSHCKDLLEGKPFEAPSLPFGGMEETDWSPDGKMIAYTCKPLTGKQYAESTNSDIFLYDIEANTTKNLSFPNAGYDKNPRFSPDGKKIVWESMERDGYESDQIRPVMYSFDSDSKCVKEFITDATNFLWAKDSKTIYFLAPWHARVDIYKWDLTGDSISRITDGPHDYTSIQISNNNIIGRQMSITHPVELFSVDASGCEKQISNVNTDLLSKLNFGKVEEHWIKTVDGKDMLVMVILPYNFDHNKKYPALLYCEGGPQSMVSYFWSYRWNFQMMASGEYVIVAPNRRGLPGFGREWCEQISGDYGGLNQQDYLAAIDYAVTLPFVDGNNLGCCGASYGGFSVYWLAGHHNKRFKAFLAHDGMFNFNQQYLETEELWFTNWDLGGPYWDKNNKTAQKSYASSPHLFVEKWDTPICIIHSELDYRIVASQGMAAFNAAQMRKIPSRYLYFPDENHWVLKPQNSILWHRNFLNWFDTYLKK